eukprot:scaffold216260_cov37-Prasinocladus_malaysianus.AAC.1
MALVLGSSHIVIIVLTGLILTFSYTFAAATPKPLTFKADDGIEEYGNRSSNSVLPLDNTDQSNITHAVEQHGNMLADGGGLFVGVVNNAGQTKPAELELDEPLLPEGSLSKQADGPAAGGDSKVQAVLVQADANSSASHAHDRLCGSQSMAFMVAAVLSAAFIFAP